MTKEKVFEQMNLATKLVKSWPEWKQHILEHSMKPTLSVPRKPIINA